MEAIEEHFGVKLGFTGAFHCHHCPVVLREPTHFGILVPIDLRHGHCHPVIEGAKNCVEVEVAIQEAYGRRCSL